MGDALAFARTCERSFNERTGTPFNHIEVPTDIVFQVLYCRLRFKLSYRDVAELFWLRGFHFTHETVRDWSERFTAELAEHLRVKRQRTFGRIWYVDETDIKIQGRGCYLYRSIDEYGNRLDVRLIEHRDMEAAKAFFEPVAEWMSEPPECVVTDGHSRYPRAISEVLGKAVPPEVSQSVNNPVEQSHRQLKQRYYPTMGFSNVKTASYFCEAVEELNQFLRVRRQMTEFVSLSEHLTLSYRGLYHFAVARQKGIASEPVSYFAAVENQDLGVVKKLRNPLAELDLSPFPRDDLTFTPSV